MSSLPFLLAAAPESVQRLASPYILVAFGAYMVGVFVLGALAAADGKAFYLRTKTHLYRVEDRM